MMVSCCFLKNVKYYLNFDTFIYANLQIPPYIPYRPCLLGTPPPLSIAHVHCTYVHVHTCHTYILFCLGARRWRLTDPAPSTILLQSRYVTDYILTLPPRRYNMAIHSLA